MNRRDFNKVLSVTLAAPLLPHTRANAGDPQAAHSHDQLHSSVPAGPSQQIAMLLYPSFIPLDLFGPHAVFALLSYVNVHLVW